MNYVHSCFADLLARPFRRFDIQVEEALPGAVEAPTTESDVDHCVTVLQGRSALHALQKIDADIDSVCALPPMPFAHPTWVRCIQECLLDPDHLFLVVVRSKKKAVRGMLALTRTADSKLHLINNHMIPEPTCLLYDTEKTLGYLIHASVASGFPVRLPRLKTESAGILQTQKHLRTKAIAVSRSAVATQFVRMSESWQAFEATLSSRRRSDLRRARRRAREFGELRAEISAPAPADIEDCFERFCRVENESWKGSAGTALQQDTSRREFFRRVLTSPGMKENVRFAVLHLDDSVAASQILFEYENRLWIMKIGYSEKFARCSPGTLLTHEVLRHAHSARLEAVEFLGMSESWLRLWNPEEHSYKTLRLYPYSVSGLSAFGRDATRYILRRFQRDSG